MSLQKWLRRRKAKLIAKKILRLMQQDGGNKRVTVADTAPRWYFNDGLGVNRAERLRKMTRIISEHLWRATGNLHSISIQEHDGGRVTLTVEPFTSEQYATYKIVTPLTHP